MNPCCIKPCFSIKPSNRSINDIVDDVKRLETNFKQCEKEIIDIQATTKNVVDKIETIKKNTEEHEEAVFKLDQESIKLAKECCQSSEFALSQGLCIDGVKQSLCHIENVVRNSKINFVNAAVRKMKEIEVAENSARNLDAMSKQLENVKKDWLEIVDKQKEIETKSNAYKEKHVKRCEELKEVEYERLKDLQDINMSKTMYEMKCCESGKKCQNIMNQLNCLVDAPDSRENCNNSEQLCKFNKCCNYYC